MMKLQSLITALATTAAIALNATTTLSQSNPDQDVRFICATSRRGNVPTTYAWTPRGKIAVIRWQAKDFNDAGYSPQRRCSEVSSRFQTAYNHGSLDFITNGKVDGKPAICTARQVEGACADLLLTLRSQENPFLVLQQLNEVLQGENAGPLPEAGKVRHLYIRTNIQKFLGTATPEKD